MNKHNQKEIQEAQHLAAMLGVRFILDPIGLSDDLPDVIISSDIEKRKESWLPQNNKYIYKYYKGHYKQPLNNGPCLFLFKNIFINPDGRIFPCCFVSDKNNVYGDLLEDSLYDIWNNEQYKFSRSLFTGIKYHGTIKKTICAECNNFTKAVK